MRVPIVQLILALILLTGCISPVPAPEEPVLESDAPTTLPEKFHKTYVGLEGGVILAVGGLVLFHQFDVESDAFLHAYSHWSTPEPLVDVELRRGGEILFAESFKAQTPGGWQDDIPLEPGSYEFMVRVYGVGTLKEFSMGGTFDTPAGA